MAWEISAALSNSEPPFQLFSASTANVNSWSQEVLTLPGGDELGFRRRQILSIECRAISIPNAGQLNSTIFNYATFCFLSRQGRPVTPHVMTRIYMTASGAVTDLESSPIFHWINPFLLPARGGDSLTIYVPGDADATPIQDWELSVLMGRELR